MSCSLATTLRASLQDVVVIMGGAHRGVMKPGHPKTQPSSMTTSVMRP